MLPSALLCNVYVISLIYWSRSAATSIHPCPNIRYAWNLASKSLSEDYYCPGISTVLASISNLGGRPITTMTGNAVNAGRMISLTHSLGLNRNPAPWKIPRHEKRMRVRVWWAVLIHDWWYVYASFHILGSFTLQP